ncbi:cell division protein FtsZ, partial [Flavobacterium sp.]|uniref:cell division protein FtsZ n=1 Tax=Flavobacterium sp. TaxID=239 RepID=UPI00286AD3A1
VVCNTDSQALDNSPVPNKIQLGVNLTEGMGAGANPDVGQQSALESIEDIEKMLDTNTKMIFITAGMGGGTGTGAAPVIAQLAKERDILTVGIVTIPFQFEGKVRIEQALLGVEKLRKQVDSLIVINNNKLREVYGNLGFKAGFSKADEVLATASRGIAEVITHHYTQNIDLKDAKTVLSNSGTAIMGSAKAEGENRAKEAIVSALDSPLLNDNKIAGAKNVLLLIVSGTNEITIDEIGEINDHIQAEAGHNANIIMGVGEDENLADSIAVTIIATGFCVEQQNEIVNTEPKKIIHALEDDQRIVRDLTQKYVAEGFDFSSNITSQEKINEIPVVDEKIVFSLEEEIPVVVTPVFTMDLVPTSEFIKNIDVTFEVVSSKTIDVNDFYFTSPEVKQIEVIDPVFVVKEDQIAFTFDLPIQKSTPKEINTDRLLFDLTNEIKEIKVNQAIEFVPLTEVSQNGVIKHSLEEYMEKENQLFEAKKTDLVVDITPEELNLTMKQVDINAESTVNTENKVSPLEMSIEETLKMRAEERRRKMKEFNYKFHNNASKVDEFEKEPAYRRMGIDITNNPTENNRSRMSLGTDSNDEVQLRSNNSFLHDNVD